MLQMRFSLTFIIVFYLFIPHSQGVIPSVEGFIFAVWSVWKYPPVFKTPYSVHFFCSMERKMRADYEEGLLSLLESRFCNWFLCDWLKIFTPLCRPISSKNKRWLTYVFPRLSRLYVVSFRSDWFIPLSGHIVIGQDWCDVTQMKTFCNVFLF